MEKGELRLSVVDVKSVYARGVVGVEGFCDGVTGVSWLKNLLKVEFFNQVTPFVICIACEYYVRCAGGGRRRAPRRS